MALAALVFLTVGCSEEAEAERYEVRGQIVRAEYGGLALRIDHEPIPGFMDAMRMSFRLQSPEEARNLNAGDKIRFLYVVGPNGSYIRDIERLPADTELDLDGITPADTLDQVGSP